MKIIQERGVPTKLDIYVCTMQIKSLYPIIRLNPVFEPRSKIRLSAITFVFFISLTSER